MAKVICWLILIASDIPSMMLRGFVLSRLWFWFVVPLGVKPIFIWQAIGLSLIVGIMRNPFLKEDWKDDDSFTHKAIAKVTLSITGSLMVWGMGAIVVSFA